MGYSKFLVFLTAIICIKGLTGCSSLKVNQSEVGQGWSGNSVNTVIFRNSAITTHKNVQFTAYYDNDGYMILAKRQHGQKVWQVAKTQYKGNIKDAHNDISIAVDVSGYLHVSWDHHDTRLRYARGTEPLGLILDDEQSMVGDNELKVTYPEFHNLPRGRLLFCYRSGASGRGNMVINSYDVATQKWTRLQDNLLNGENVRSAYWQMCIDANSNIHLSWVWRESWDVADNHDICYAISKDGGVSWERSNGDKYNLPITMATAEIAWEIPKNSSLINQTSMTVDADNNPYIANYWNDRDKPQYKVVYLKEGKWNLKDTDFRQGSFSLGGGGTKSIPISRPEILINKSTLYLLYRDSERDNKITLASTNINKNNWELLDLTNQSVGQWEPNYDKEWWAQQKQLHIFSQKVTQVDGEGVKDVLPEPVTVIEAKNLPKQ
ncbi:neuraminidase [Flavobacterium sp. Sd200]|uniref:BNR repeat-containing protein n=1 Tax=Flavobacterium sp. Sd200 TaxID=2692211 RepID=UPI00136F4830|nr:BNR repeat-containing protein [Flavobacterium sp. Sd200]MXN90780.1 neuraminidase [Flavobacterium sp. Sd200]